MKDITYGDLFDTPQKRASAVAAVRGLRRSGGWQIITQILDLNIVYCEKLILEGQDIITGESLELTPEKLQELKSNRYFQKMLKQLPETIEEEFKAELKGVKVLDPDDPYDQNEDQS